MWYGQLESVWPVHGNIMITDGVAWFVAGRSLFTDGGMRLYRLDAVSGKVLTENRMDHHGTEKGKLVQDYARQHNMPVALPDILSTDGKLVYMRSQPFKLNGKRLPMKARQYGGNPQRYSIKPTQNREHYHLFSPAGFLDSTWWHRTYWVYGSRFNGGWAGYPQAGKVTPAGKIMVFGDKKVYGYGRLPRFYRCTTPIEHQLFCTPKSKPVGRAVKDKAATGSWVKQLPIMVRAMVLTGGKLCVAGPPDVIDERKAVRSLNNKKTQKKLAEQDAAFRGELGGQLWILSTEDAKRLSTVELESPPVFDGMAASDNKLYMCTTDGKVVCFTGK